MIDFFAHTVRLSVVMLVRVHRLKANKVSLPLLNTRVFNVIACTQINITFFFFPVPVVRRFDKNIYHLMSNEHYLMISGEMIVWFAVVIAAIGWHVDGYIEDLCPNCNLYQDSAEVSAPRCSSCYTFIRLKWPFSIKRRLVFFSPPSWVVQ